jgi:hypothetical protein
MVLDWNNLGRTKLEGLQGQTKLGGEMMENEALSDVRDTYERYAQDWTNVKRMYSILVSANVEINPRM